MKTFKLKSLLTGLGLAMSIAIFMTACQQENLELDIPDTTTISENLEVETDDTAASGDLESRCSIPVRSIVNNRLDFLITKISTFNNNPNSANKSEVRNAYQNYRNYLNNTIGACQGVNVPQPVWNGSCQPTNFSNCPKSATSKLESLQCAIKRFINNPNSCSAKRDLQRKFFRYTEKVNNCFGTNLASQRYANRLRLSGCGGYTF